MCPGIHDEYSRTIPIGFPMTPTLSPSVNLEFRLVYIVACLANFKKGTFFINSKAPECSPFYMEGGS